MKVPKFARKLKYRLLGTGVKPHAPNFSEHEMVGTLMEWLEAFQSSNPDCKINGWRPPACSEDVTAYFRQRKHSASFFADADTLGGLARRITSVHPEWRKRLLAVAAADRTDGLKIYSMRGPPLRPGFPWGGLQSEPNNDDLYSIRPHRFVFAPRHALAVLYGAESAEVLAGVLEDWMAFAERSKSELPYCSALVVIQRLLSLSWAMAFIMAVPDGGDSAATRLHADVLRILHADICFLMPRLGKSAPNNHLLADRFASWYIRLLYPEFVRGPVDLDAHEALWLAELDRQIYPDGTSFEHSLHYHEFACEMAAAYVLLCRRNSRPVPFATLKLVERMLAFQTGLAGPGCVTMPVGDAVEDPLFGLDPGEGWGTAGLREIHRALFNPELDPSPPAAHSVERAFWLLGGALEPRGASSPVDPELGPRVWPDGGFAILPDASSSARLIFRTGPALNQRLFAGHMHADLLSVCVTRGDQAVLTDAGTFSYRWRSTHAGPARAYFSGPAAHNGLTIDGGDPLGTVRGDFRQREIPVRVTTTRRLLGTFTSWVEAELRGGPPYAGHRRGVVHVSGMYWVIYDQLPPGVGTDVASIGFQAAAGVEATREEPGMVRLASSAGTMWLAAGPGLGEVSILNGGTVPPGGWVAPSYGELTPAPQLRYQIVGDAAVTALTLGSGATAKPALVRVVRGGLILEIEGSETSDRLLLATHDEAIRVHTSDGHGCAAALWLRSRPGQPEMVRCLGFQESECSETETSSRRHASDMRAMLTMDSGVREIEFREPKDLSISFSGETWY
jgi:hypothetical protein